MIVGLDHPGFWDAFCCPAKKSPDLPYVSARAARHQLPASGSFRIPKATVEQNLMAILETLPLRGRERTERMNSLIEQLGLQRCGTTRLRTFGRGASTCGDGALTGHESKLSAAR